MVPHSLLLRNRAKTRQPGSPRLGPVDGRRWTNWLSAHPRMDHASLQARPVDLAPSAHCGANAGRPLPPLRGKCAGRHLPVPDAPGPGIRVYVRVGIDEGNAGLRGLRGPGTRARLPARACGPRENDLGAQQQDNQAITRQFRAHFDLSPSPVIALRPLGIISNPGRHFGACTLSPLVVAQSPGYLLAGWLQVCGETVQHRIPPSVDGGLSNRTPRYPPIG